MSKLKTGWYSPRLARDVSAVRWGETGVPVLIFPTAGGDAEEIERFFVVDSLSKLLEAGRIKIYSCDSVAGRAMLVQEGTVGHRMWLLNQFQQFVYEEMLPAIRSDCRSKDIGIMAAGSSIGAFSALAMVCRFPDAFTHALCLSGTYELLPFFGRDIEATEDFYFSSPSFFLPNLSGELLERLRTRFVLFASGEGNAENIDESWRAADLLGGKGVPNRVDSWGPDSPHDWVTWRKMFPHYLDELTRTG